MTPQPPRGGNVIARSMRVALRQLQPDSTGVLFDQNEANPLPLTFVTVTNTRAMKSTRETSKFWTGVVPAGTPVIARQLLAHGTAAQIAADQASGPATAATAAWYVVQDVGTTPAGALALMPREVQLRALPLVVTAERANPVPIAPPAVGSAAARTTDDYGQPYARADGQPLIQSYTLRLGVSNDLDQSDDQTGAGPVVTGLLTAYTPLGSPIGERDIITVDGVRYSVKNKQTLDSGGRAFAWQLMLSRLSGGPIS